VVEITVTRHARAKLRERALPLDVVKRVIEAPNYRFYDVISGGEVSIGEVEFRKTRIVLAVVFIRRGERISIVTAYPCSRMLEEIERKKKSGRWTGLVS